MGEQDQMNEELKRLIDDLQHGDESARRYAAEDIEYGGYREAIPYLAAGLTDVSIAVAEACSGALIKLGGAEVAELVAPHLASEDVRLRNHTAEILAKLGEVAVPTLEKQLQSDDRDVRKFAVDTLVEIGSASIEALKVALTDVDVNIASTAADGIGMIGNQSHIPLLIQHVNDEDEWMQCAVLRGLGNLGGKEALKALLPKIADTNVMIKFTAIQALAKVEDPEALSPLLSLLNGPLGDLVAPEVVLAAEAISAANPKLDFPKLFEAKLLPPICKQLSLGGKEVRIKASKLLELCRSDRTLPELLALFGEEDEEVRQAAIDAVMAIAPQDPWPLRDILEDKRRNSLAKSAAIQCLGRLGTKDTSNILSACLKSEDINLVSTTLEVLPKEVTPIPFDEINNLIKHEDPAVRKAAAEAAGRICHENFVEGLITHLNDKDREVQEACDNALILIGNQTGNKMIQPYLDSISPSERKMAFEFFGENHPESIKEKFVAGLHDPTVEIRVISFKVLANLKRLSYKDIATGLTDPVDGVRVEAVRSIASLPDDQAKLDFIKSHIPKVTDTHLERVKVEILKLLSRMNPDQAIELILPLLEDGSTWVQVEAVEALKILGNKDVIDDLRKLLDSDNQELVEAVESAIDELEFS